MLNNHLLFFINSSSKRKNVISKRELIMTDDNQPRFGFVNFAETWNGRMAMMGILIGLGTELITGQSILRQIGIG